MATTLNTAYKEPPVGLKPRWLHNEERKEEIFKAMFRYSEAELPIPREWIVELFELCEAQK